MKLFEYKFNLSAPAERGKLLRDRGVRYDFAQLIAQTMVWATALKKPLFSMGTHPEEFTISWEKDHWAFSRTQGLCSDYLAMEFDVDSGYHFWLRPNDFPGWGLDCRGDTWIGLRPD